MIIRPRLSYTPKVIKQKSKVDRLKEIEQKFGPQYVLPYRVCTSWPEIQRATEEFESHGRTWGLRTDIGRKSKSYENHNLPFILRGNRDGARQVWEANQEALTYIVSHNILTYHCNAVAERIDPEHVKFEYNAIDRTIAQRNMYDNLANLRQIIVGPRRATDLRREIGEVNKGFISGPIDHVATSEDNFVRDLKFHKIYELMMLNPDEKEITFSVTGGFRNVVIW